MLQNQYVGFTVDNESYGIEIMSIQEITEYSAPTKMPNSPGFIEGVINLRGIVIPVINLKEKLHLKDTEIKKNSKIIIISLEEKQVGFIVDEASQVITLKETDIAPAPDLVGGVNKNFIVGIAKIDKNLIILLDLVTIFSTEELNDIEKMKVG